MNQKVIVVSIVENTYGSKIMDRIKKECGGMSSVFYGQGTVQDGLLNILGFYEEKKEICFSVIDKEHEDLVYATLEQKLKLAKAGHGVMFSIPMRSAQDDKKELEITMKEAIFVVVDDGRAEAVVESANKAGARGGTIIHARGKSQTATKKLFHLDIEPEQEIVLIVADKSKGTRITDAITQDLKLEDGDNGHLFVVDVSRTSGFHKHHIES